MPERTRKSKLCLVNKPIVFVPPLKNAIDQANTKMTTVRIAVAKSVSTFLIPILAKMAVNAAKKADNNAYIHHISYILFGLKQKNESHVFHKHSFRHKIDY